MDSTGTRLAIAALAFSATGLVYVAQREDFRAMPYRDSAGVLTDGYGNTHGVKANVPTTPARALVKLRANAGDVELAVKRCVKVPLHPYEFDAYVALAFNVGPGAFCRRSPDPANPYLIDLINAQRYPEACERIRAFNKFTNPETGAKQVSPGLVKFREIEYRMCMGLPGATQ